MLGLIVVQLYLLLVLRTFKIFIYVCLSHVGISGSLIQFDEYQDARKETGPYRFQSDTPKCQERSVPRVKKDKCHQNRADDVMAQRSW